LWLVVVVVGRGVAANFCSTVAALQQPFWKRLPTSGALLPKKTSSK